MQTKLFFLTLLCALLLGCGGEPESAAIQPTPTATNIPIQPTENPAIALVETGQQKASQADLAGALADFEAAIAADPNYAEAHIQFAITHGQLDDNVTALASLEKALTLEPNNPKALYNKGVILHRMGDWSGAIAQYTLAIEQEETVQPLFNRGLIHVERQNFELALTDFNQVIALDPAFDAAYAARGDIYYAQQQLEQAITDYGSAIELNPSNMAHRYNRGLYLVENGEADKAIADFETILTQFPEDAQALNGLGYAYQQTGQFSQAITHYTQLLKLDPTYELAHGNFQQLLYDEVLISPTDLPSSWTQSFVTSQDPSDYLIDDNNNVFFIDFCDIAIPFTQLTAAPNTYFFDENEYELVNNGATVFADETAASAFMSTLQTEMLNCRSFGEGFQVWSMRGTPFETFGSDEQFVFWAYRNELFVTVESLYFIVFRQDNVVVNLIYYQDSSQNIFASASAPAKQWLELVNGRLIAVLP